MSAEPRTPHTAIPHTPTARQRPAVPLWREAVGAVLRSARLELGRRLVDVAGDAGVSPQYLSEVERGLKDPSSEMLAAISGALGMDVGTVTGLAAAQVRAADARRTGALILELRSDLTVARRAELGVAVHGDHTPSSIWALPDAAAAWAAPAVRTTATTPAAAYLLAA